MSVLLSLLDKPFPLTIFISQMWPPPHFLAHYLSLVWADPSHLLFPPLILDPHSHFSFLQMLPLKMLAWYMSLSRNIMLVLTYKRYCAIDPAVFLNTLFERNIFNAIYNLIQCFIHVISKYSPPQFYLAIPYWWIPHYHKQCCSGHPMNLPLWIFVCIYLDYAPRIGTAGSKSIHILNVIYFCHIALHNGCTIYTPTSTV